jgi:hypothetical protein
MEKKRALVDLDWQTLSRRSSIGHSYDPYSKNAQFTPTLGGGGFNFGHARSGSITDENFNSINSPQSGASPQQSKIRD